MKRSRSEPKPERMNFPNLRRDRPPTCSSEDLGAFTKQLSTLVGSGVPLHRAVEILAGSDTHVLYERVLPELLRRMEHGQSLSRSAALFPQVFPPTYVSLLGAAEKSGALVVALNRLTEWLDRSVAQTRKVKKALTYPMVVLALCLGLTFLLFKTVIPGILETTLGLGVEFPWPTKMLNFMVQAIEQPVFWFLVVVLGAAFIYFVNSPEGKYRVWALGSVTPVVGPILIQSAASRYTFTLAMLCQSGVDLTRATRDAARASGSLLVEEDSARVYTQLRQGKRLSTVLADQMPYPLLLTQMLQVAEEVGDFDRFMARACKLLEEDTEYRLDRLGQLLEPLIMAGLSLFVGFVMVATILPLANLASSL